MWGSGFNPCATKINRKEQDALWSRFSPSTQSKLFLKWYTEKLIGNCLCGEKVDVYMTNSKFSLITLYSCLLFFTHYNVVLSSLMTGIHFAKCITRHVLTLQCAYINFSTNLLHFQAIWYISSYIQSIVAAYSCTTFSIKSRKLAKHRNAPL